nr:adenosylcobinamide-phosphate synthase CbiB [uncultured Sellimonas sp.]
MMILAACAAGFVLDLMFGDPVWLYHPVRLIGKLIGLLEKVLYKEGAENKSLFARGIFLWILTVGISAGIPVFVLWSVGKISPVLLFLLETFWCYQILATRSLKTESMKVYDALKTGTIEDARYAVSMIVGRDTKALTEEGVTKAAVETVAENTSDGIIAPLFYLMIGGAGLGFFYKAVNTMDSMIGYKNDRYLYFGRAAAKMDDVLNWIPARLSAFLMIGATGILSLTDQSHFHMKQAWKIYRRDRRNHKSPNAAQTEAVCAGALSVQLAGNAYYFGKLYEKPYIGDPIRKIEIQDIVRVNRLLYVSAWMGLLIFSFIRVLFIG